MAATATWSSWLTRGSPRMTNNGGPTQTIALLAGSPAIGAGSNALAVDPTRDRRLTTDQRGAGFPRIVDGGRHRRFRRPVFGSPTVYTVNSTGSGSSGTRHLGDSSLRHQPGQRQHQPGRQCDRVRPDGLQPLLTADDHSDQHAGAGRTTLAGSDPGPWGGRRDDQRQQCRSGVPCRCATTATITGLTIADGNGGANQAAAASTIRACSRSPAARLPTTLPTPATKAIGAGIKNSGGGSLTVTDSQLRTTQLLLAVASDNSGGAVTLTDCLSRATQPPRRRCLPI